MKSITGVEINNPEVCIKEMGTTFACICPKCMDEARLRMDQFIKDHLDSQDTNNK